MTMLLKVKKHDEQNFLAVMLAKHYAMCNQDIGDKILEYIKLFCRQISQEEVKVGY